MRLALMRRVGDRLRDESGIALVMALGIMLALTIALGAVISFTTAGSRDAHRTNAGQKAFAYAEAGINNAVSVLNTAYNAGNVDFYSPASSGRVDPATLLPSRTSTYDGSSVVWSGTYCLATNSLAEQAAGCSQLNDLGLWRIKATASVANPTGPGAAPVRRTVTAVVQAVLPSGTPPSSALWNWVYSGKPPTPRTNTADIGYCDTIISNSTQVSSPLYVAGNLCLGQQTTIVQPTGGSPLARVGQTSRLVVGGFLRNDSPQNREGEDTALGRLTAATIMDSGRPAGTPAAGCSDKGRDVSGTWRFEACGIATNVFVDAGKLYTTPPDGTVASPAIVPLDSAACPATGECVDLNQLYAISFPGPLHPCATASTDTATTQAPPVFDSNTVRDNSLPTVQNLTPAKSYQCTTVGGEISWNAGTKVLTIKGPIFFDGSIYIDPPALATYSGRGSIFVSGTFVLKNNTICAQKNSAGTDCDYDGWDPNVGSTGSALSVAAMGDCANGGLESQQMTCNATDHTGIQIKGGSFQGLMFARKDIDIVTSGRVQGPMVTPATVKFGQSTTGTFPPLAILPTGTPGTRLPPATVAKPKDFGGG